MDPVGRALISDGAFPRVCRIDNPDSARGGMDEHDRNIQNPRHIHPSCIHTDTLSQRHKDSWRHKKDILS